MSNDRTKNTDDLNMSDLGADLPAAAAALSAEDRAGLVNALKDKLQLLAGQHVDILETLSPKVRKRVEVLKDLQSQHDELQAKFLEERASLEAKYQKLYEPLYTKRYEIVNGIVEVEGITNEALPEEEKRATEEKGVPDFWLTAMKTNETLAEEITERDEGALKYLKDIKWFRIGDPKGFKLEFFFDSNPYFKNSVLTKTYHMIDEDDPILEKAIGTEIEWCPGKCLTQKVLKKKPKKGSKNAKPITKIEKCDSFFNFFNPPQVPEDDDDIDDDAVEELHSLMEQDYDIGKDQSTADIDLQKKMLTFMESSDGDVTERQFRAGQSDYEDIEADEDEYDDEDGDEDEDDNDDEDNEDDEEDEKKEGKSRTKRSGKTQPGRGQLAERPPECHQQ